MSLGESDDTNDLPPDTSPNAALMQFMKDMNKTMMETIKTITDNQLKIDEARVKAMKVMTDRQDMLDEKRIEGIKEAEIQRQKDRISDQNRELERIEKERELLRESNFNQKNDHSTMMKEMETSRKEENLKRDADRIQMEEALKTMLKQVSDTQSANAQTIAAAVSNPTPAPAPSSSVGLSSVAASTVQIFDVSKCNPVSHCHIHHDNAVVNAKLLHIHWDDGKPTYEVEPIGYYKGYTTIEVDKNDIWPYNSSLNNYNRDNHVSFYKIDILASPYTPSMTVKYTKGMDEIVARISRVTLVDPEDPSINNSSYTYKTVDPTNSLEVFDDNLLHSHLTRTPLDSAYRVNQRKALTYLLTNKAPKLAELSTIGVKNFYREITLWLKGHEIDLLPYDDIARGTDLTTYSDHLTTKHKHAIFSFLSRIDVIPPELHDARSMIEYSADNDGALILFQLMLQWHPNLQLGGSISLEPSQENSETIATFVLRYHSFVREENRRGRRYEDIEILERIYSKMTTKGFKYTRRDIEITIAKYYSTSRPLPPGYCSQFLSSTLHQIHARTDGKKDKEQLRVNQLHEGIDDAFVDAAEDLSEEDMETNYVGGRRPTRPKGKDRKDPRGDRHRDRMKQDPFFKRDDPWLRNCLTKWVDINFTDEFRKKFRINKQSLTDEMYRAKRNAPPRQPVEGEKRRFFRPLVNMCIADYDHIEEMQLCQLTLDDHEDVCFDDPSDEPVKD